MPQATPHLFGTGSSILVIKLFILLASILPAACQTTSFSNEIITAQGLLGSHFGVPGLPGSFDYVIAGGGTAGLALARRLAANNSISVAVIEAGDFYEFSNGNLSEIPANAGSFVGSNPIQKNPLLDWYQYTVRQAVRSLQTDMPFGGRLRI